MSEQTAQQLLREVLLLKGEVLLVKAQGTETHSRLFGNGQPGELSDMRDQIKASENWITRADEREKTNRKWTASIGTLCGLAAGAVGSWLAKHFG